MSNPEIEVEEILNVFLPFGQEQLEKKGEFFPYGGVLKADGELAFVAGYDGKDQPSSEEVISQLKTIFCQSAKNADYKATGLFFDVRVPLPNSHQKSDAIAVMLDHKDDYSIIAFIPYKLQRSKFLKRIKVEFGNMFFQAGKNDIFAS